MTQPAKGQEPSMEEILASIRRIIADEEPAKGTTTEDSTEREGAAAPPEMAPRPMTPPPRVAPAAAAAPAPPKTDEEIDAMLAHLRGTSRQPPPASWGRPKRQPRPSRHPRSKHGAPRSTSAAFSPPRPPPRSTPLSIRLRERRRRAAVARSRKWSANCCGRCSRVGSTKISRRWSSAWCAPRSNACRADEVEHEQAADAVCGSMRRAAGQAHRKHRTLARLTRHRHVAAHHARELAREGKAEPRPAVAARCQGIGLDEVLEQFCLLLRRHADAAIRDRKLDPVAAVRHLAHAQGDLAFFRELAGVAQEIEQYLLEAH